MNYIYLRFYALPIIAVLLFVFLSIPIIDNIFTRNIKNMYLIIFCKAIIILTAMYIAERVIISSIM